MYRSQKSHIVRFATVMVAIVAGFLILESGGGSSTVRGQQAFISPEATLTPGERCASVDVPQVECEALVALYVDTSGPSWTNSTHWLDEDGTVCDWYGVACTSGNVWGLYLTNNGLVGTLPDLSGLPQLRYLYLAYNQFNAPFPVWINSTNLPNLQILSMLGNGWTGEFPDLSGFGPILIRIGQNPFTPGPVPSWLVNMSGLGSIYIERTGRTGTVGELASASTLVNVDLSGNALTELPSNLSEINYPNLNSLLFDSNLLSSLPVGIAMLDTPFIDAGFNQLSTTTLDPDVVTWLDSKQPTWSERQIVSPTNLSVGAVTTSSIDVSWTAPPIAAWIQSFLGGTSFYTDVYKGEYLVGYSTTPGGPYTFVGSPSPGPLSLEETSRQITGLAPGTTYYLVVQTVWNSNVLNPNSFTTVPSDEIPGATISEPTNTPTYTFTPSDTPTNTPTDTPTNTPTYTSTATDTPTNTPTFTPTHTPTNTPTDTPTNTPTYTSTATDTPTNTPTYTSTATYTPTNTPTETPSNTPTNTSPAPTATAASLLLNGSFEIAGLSGREAENWTGKNLLNGDKRKCSKPAKPLTTVDGDCVFQFNGGTPATPGRKLSQVVIANGWGSAGETLAISAHVTGKQLGSGMKLILKVTYTDSSNDKIKIDIPAGTYAFTQIGGTLPITQSITQAKVDLNAKSTSGRVRVDVVELFATPAAPSGSFRGSN